MTRLLAIDLGRRRIGVAVADDVTGSVRPLTTVARRDAEHDATLIGRLADEQSAGAFVVGLPLSMDGSEGPQADETRAWSAEVLTGLGRPIQWQDERLTSARAEERRGRPRRARGGGPPSSDARSSYRARIDRDAAALIGQAALDMARDTQPTPTAVDRTR